MSKNCCGPSIDGIVSGYSKLIMNQNKKLAASRRAVCRVCPNNVLGLCTLCGCLIVAKVRDPAQQCPDTPARWLAVA